QSQPAATRVRVLVNRVQPSRVERARAANDAMHLVTLRQKELGEIRPVLSRDARDQCAFGHRSFRQASGREWARQAWNGSGVLRAELQRKRIDKSGAVWFASLRKCAGFCYHPALRREARVVQPSSTFNYQSA